MEEEYEFKSDEDLKKEMTRGQWIAFGIIATIIIGGIIVDLFLN